MEDVVLSPKEIVRQEALRYRDKMEIDPVCADNAMEQFFKSIPVFDTDIVAVYYPKGKEIDTAPIVQKLWERSIRCCLPVITEGDKLLSFAQWRAGSILEQDFFGIPVPKDEPYVLPDIVIVPLVAFDQQGNRLGYGKGYYDVTLKGLRANKQVLAVGLAYAEQACLLRLPTEEHDERLDYVVTPQRIFDFRAIER